MNDLSRCLIKMSPMGFDFFSCSRFSRSLTPPLFARYFSTFPSLENQKILEQRQFYNMRPSFHQILKKSEQRTAVVQGYEGEAETLLVDHYSKMSRSIIGWVYRQATPAVLWQRFHSPSSEPEASSLSLNLETLVSEGSREEKITNIQTFLEREGGEGFKNLSLIHLTTIWGQLKGLGAYDEMVEFLNACHSSSFTSRSDILADYLFAHLHSSYARPYLVREIAKNLTHPQAGYVRGLAHLMSSQIAKKMTSQIQAKNIFPSTLTLYRENFPDHAIQDKESRMCYQQTLAEAEQAFQQAYQEDPLPEYAVGWLLTLVEKGNFASAHTLAKDLWEKLNQKAERSLNETQACLLAGIMTDQSFSHLEKLAGELKGGRTAKEVCLESLEVLLPYYSITHQLIARLAINSIHS